LQLLLTTHPLLSGDFKQSRCRRNWTDG